MQVKRVLEARDQVKVRITRGNENTRSSLGWSVLRGQFNNGRVGGRIKQPYPKPEHQPGNVRSTKFPDARHDTLLDEFDAEFSEKGGVLGNAR